MMNFFDLGSVESLANSRRERFLQEVEQDRIARMLSTSRQATPNRFRRAVGAHLIRAGARLSGDHTVVVRQTGALT